MYIRRLDAFTDWVPLKPSMCREFDIQEASVCFCGLTFQLTCFPLTPCLVVKKKRLEYSEIIAKVFASPQVSLVLVYLNKFHIFGILTAPVHTHVTCTCSCLTADARLNVLQLIIRIEALLGPIIMWFVAILQVLSVRSARTILPCW